MYKHNTVKNARLSILQVVVSSIVLFILYRYLLDTLGAAQLGLWSLVLATTSISRLSELGLSGSALKFVAKYLARNEPKQASNVIQTTLLSIAAIIGLIVLIAYPLVGWILRQVIPAKELGLALSLLPYALISLWLSAIAGVVTSGLEGCQRFDLRAYLQMMAHVLSLLSVIWLVPAYGLYGVAYAQLLQVTFILVFSWLLLRYTLPEVPFIPWRWSSVLFREMLSYGIHFQIISIAQLVYDPITKALLSKFGGLELTGYYEMATRLVLQLRSLLANANRVLIPVFANLQETAPQQITALYQNSYKVVFYFSVLVYGLVLAYVPVISELWLGHYENAFVIFTALLTIGWAINNLSAPAYFTYLGTGQLRWNTVGHVLIAVLNGILGITLGVFWGGTGVVIGWVISLIVGSSFLVYIYHSKHHISFWTLLPIESRGLVVVVGMGILMSWVTYKVLHNLDFRVGSLIGSMMIYVTVIAYPFWQHSLRKKVLEMLYLHRHNP